MVETRVESNGQLVKVKKPSRVVKYFVGFWLLLALVTEWIFDMAVQIVQVVHGGMEGAAKALQRKYNEFNN